MSYNSIGCPKCGVSLSIDESMRGKKITCPSCNHQMLVPTYTDDEFNNEVDETYFTSKNDDSESSQSSSDDRMLAWHRHFFSGVILILLILVFSLIVNILMLTSFASIKRTLQQGEDRDLLQPVQKRATAAVAPQEWEYLTLSFNGALSEIVNTKDSAPLFYHENELTQIVAEQAKLRWQLVNVIPISETVFPNVSDDKLIPHYLPNTRTQCLLLVFRREKED